MIDQSKISRAFTHISIPREIWLSNDLSLLEKCLYVEIISLSLYDVYPYGCFASNEYFSNFFGVSERWISKSISKLRKIGLISQESLNGRKRLLIPLSVLPRVELQFHPDQNKSSTLFPIIESKSIEKTFFIYSEKYQYLSELMISKIKTIGTEMKFDPKRDLPKWNNEFRLMVEQDKRTEKQIEEKIESVYSDPFWSQTIRSPSGLRKNWKKGSLDRLNGQTSQNDQEEPKKPNTPWEELCQNSSDPGNKVFNKFCKLWESVDPGAWKEFRFIPKDTGNTVTMRNIFEIMVKHKGDTNLIIKLVKDYLEGIWRADDEY
jgi:hypothetical protein